MFSVKIVIQEQSSVIFYSKRNQMVSHDFVRHHKIRNIKPVRISVATIAR